MVARRHIGSEIVHQKNKTVNMKTNNIQAHEHLFDYMRFKHPKIFDTWSKDLMKYKQQE